ncbi:fungal chitosanase of glycosyl hydrolase group 75-domain-containing protein [Aspergillus taichungensis]|uniref:Endo-chitosanase n=1 Tax=Aspergillus taichungensis TaxID=482145 RepID=A0A2J5I7X8_9EURO|nr:fungal chitosanase of glycosyl hydrolase group 75-domain-containing protein [Aspergillus taichungensis]
MKFNQNVAALPLAGLLFAPLTLAARQVPPNLKEFYNKVQNGGDCEGKDLLAGGFYDDDKKDASFGYCNKFMGDKGFYLKGPGNKLANMDIDCDGQEKDSNDRCGGDDDTQYETRYKDEVKKMGIPDLDTYIHPYVVLGNERKDGKATFLPEKANIEPLSVVAVVCNDRLVYGVWGDTNGDDGDPLIGEASLAMADMCFGEKYSATSGYSEQDVLYIAFSGKEAVPGKNAAWDAKSYEEFEESLQDLGDTLLAKLLGSDSGFSSNGSNSDSGSGTSGGSGSGSSGSGSGAGTGNKVCRNSNSKRARAAKLARREDISKPRA